jgi:hypothetical protein
MPPRTSDTGANPISRQIELRGCPLATGRQQAPSITGPGTRPPPSPPRRPRPTQPRTTHTALLHNAALRQFAAPRCSEGDPGGRRHRNDNPPLHHHMKSPPPPHPISEMFRKACQFENADVALSGCGDTAEGSVGNASSGNQGNVVGGNVARPQPACEMWDNETRRPILSLTGVMKLLAFNSGPMTVESGFCHLVF